MALRPIAHTKTKKSAAKVKSKDEAIGKSNVEKVKSSGSKDKKVAKITSRDLDVVAGEKDKAMPNTTENVSKKKSGKQRTVDTVPEAFTAEEASIVKTVELPKASKNKRDKVPKIPTEISQDPGPSPKSVEKTKAKKKGSMSQSVGTKVSPSKRTAEENEDDLKAKSEKPKAGNGNKNRDEPTANQLLKLDISDAHPEEAHGSSTKLKKKQKNKSITMDATDAVVPPSAEQADQVDKEILLHGFSSESDSSDEDDDVDEISVDLGKLPTVAKDDATVKKKLEKAKRTPTEDRGVLYLGRIPHGFYEDEMKAYFSQFGDITRIRISRNKKTGRSKHYGFIEFASSAVAQVVSETMDNYLLMGHILRCKIIPKEDVHPELWIGSNRKFRRVPHDRIVRLQQNKIRTEDEQEKAEKRLLRRQEEKKRKLKAAGIEYDFDSVAYKKPKAIE